MNTVQDNPQGPEPVQALEFDVVKFIMNAAQSGKHHKLATLQASTQEAFPDCTELFIRQCLEKVGASLR
jgi:hypothetical protein